MSQNPMALITCVSGWFSEKTPNALGIVLVGAKVLEGNVSGKNVLPQKQIPFTIY